MSYKRKHKKQVEQIAQSLGTTRGNIVLYVMKHGNRIPIWLQNLIFKLIGSKIIVRVKP